MSDTQKFIFEYAHHEDFGIDGWRLAKYPNFDPVGGFGVAHDILEHPPLNYKKGCPLANEIMAIAAIVWTRFEMGIVIVDDNAETVADNLIDLIRDEVFYKNSQDTLSVAPNTRPLEYNDEDFTGAVTIALANLEDNGALEIDNDDSDDLERKLYKFILDNKQSIISWLRLGYRYTANRFKEYDQYNIGLLWRRIQNEVDKVQCVEIGDKLIVKLDYFNAYVDTSVRYAYENYR
jgi:hypothetical protein